MQKNIFHSLNRDLLTKVYFFFILSVVLMPQAVFAIATNPPSPGGGGSVTFTNPVASGAKTIPQLIDSFVTILVQFGIPIAAVAIIYSGLLFVTARGSEEQIKRAKQTFYFAVIGSAILLGARIIISVVVGTLGTINIPFP